MKVASEIRDSGPRVMSEQIPPLRGLRVLDLSTMVAGPLAATVLGDYGADVVKIEMPGAGDHARRFGAQKNGHGLYWKSLGRGKSCIALDLRKAEAQALVLKWIQKFDVVVENFRPGTLRLSRSSWNLRWRSLT